jgi:hypothetical protein
MAALDMILISALDLPSVPQNATQNAVCVYGHLKDADLYPATTSEHRLGNKVPKVLHISRAELLPRPFWPSDLSSHCEYVKSKVLEKDPTHLVRHSSPLPLMFLGTDPDGEPLDAKSTLFFRWLSRGQITRCAELRNPFLPPDHVMTKTDHIECALHSSDIHIGSINYCAPCSLFNLTVAIIPDFKKQLTIVSSHLPIMWMTIRC